MEKEVKELIDITLNLIRDTNTILEGLKSDKIPPDVKKSINSQIVDTQKVIDDNIKCLSSFAQTNKEVSELYKKMIKEYESTNNRTKNNDTSIQTKLWKIDQEIAELDKRMDELVEHSNENEKQTEETDEDIIAIFEKSMEDSKRQIELEKKRLEEAQKENDTELVRIIQRGIKYHQENIEECQEEIKMYSKK